jgi:hypothetical protein
MSTQALPATLCRAARGFGSRAGRCVSARREAAGGSAWALGRGAPGHAAAQQPAYRTRPGRGTACLGPDRRAFVVVGANRDTSAPEGERASKFLNADTSDVRFWLRKYEVDRACIDAPLADRGRPARVGPQDGHREPRDARSRAHRVARRRLAPRDPAREPARTPLSPFPPGSLRRGERPVAEPARTWRGRGFRQLAPHPP